MILILKLKCGIFYKSCTRKMFYIYAPVAQLVEQLPFKEMVVGSIPTGRTFLKTKSIWFLKMCEPEADGPRRGREIFQQKNTCDHKLIKNSFLYKLTLYD